jgi:cytochrome c5
MMKLDLLSAALISAALLTAPAMARESQVTSERLAANDARTPTGALSTSGQACCRNRARDLPSLGDRDAWGHWGAYYGPMVHAH